MRKILLIGSMFLGGLVFAAHPTQYTPQQILNMVFREADGGKVAPTKYTEQNILNLIFDDGSKSLKIGDPGKISSSTYADTTSSSTYATTAGSATYVATASSSTYATTAGSATYVATASSSTYATTAGSATYAADSTLWNGVDISTLSATYLNVNQYTSHYAYTMLMREAQYSGSDTSTSSSWEDKGVNAADWNNWIDSSTIVSAEAKMYFRLKSTGTSSTVSGLVGVRVGGTWYYSPQRDVTAAVYEDFAESITVPAAAFATGLDADLACKMRTKSDEGQDVSIILGRAYLVVKTEE